MSQLQVPARLSAEQDDAILGRRAELAERLRPELLIIARNRTRDQHDAEDVVSEAILRCLTFDGLDETRMGAFLTTVTMRLCADLHRRRGVEDRALVRLAPSSAMEDPHEQLADHSEAVWLSGVAMRLPERERSVLESIASGRNHRETAAELGVTTKSVECALRRARTRLRIAWQATLGLGGLALCRRHVRHAAVGMTPAALVILAVIAGPSIQPRAAHPSIHGHLPSKVAVSHRTTPGTETQPGRLRHGTRARASFRPGRVISPLPRQTRLVDVGPVGDDRVIGAHGAHVEHDHDHETFVQSVEACLDGGLTVSRNTIGCPGN